MSNVLLIYDDRHATLAVDRVLASLHLHPVHLVLEEFDAEFLLAEMFDLIIFELFTENRSCIAILQQLERLAATSGLFHPPVIVVTEQNFGIIEQALRTAKVNFFFVKPLNTGELMAAIRQALEHPKAD